MSARVKLFQQTDQIGRGSSWPALKRAYEPAEPSDGYRVLIDRLWPRGVSRERAQLDEWNRELRIRLMR